MMLEASIKKQQLVFALNRKIDSNAKKIQVGCWIEVIATKFKAIIVDIKGEECQLFPLYLSDFNVGKNGIICHWHLIKDIQQCFLTDKDIDEINKLKEIFKNERGNEMVKNEKPGENLKPIIPTNPPPMALESMQLLKSAVVENLDSVEITTNSKDNPVPKVKCYREQLSVAVDDAVKAYQELRRKLGLE